MLDVLSTLRVEPRRLPDLAKEVATALRDLYRAKHEREPEGGFEARALEIEREWLR